MAIVLNWNNLPDTLECVESLRRSEYSNLATWVVDNDSREDPSAELETRYPGVRVLRNEINFGYAGGNNRGLREAIDAGAEYVLLLNNDVIVAPETVGRLVMAAEGNARIGMASPKVFYYGRPTEIYWDGGIIDWATGDTPHDSSPLPVEANLKRSEWLDGCSLFVRAATIRDIGLLDERYFLYFEDVDWSIRAVRRGWLTVVVLPAHAWHKVSRTTGGLARPAVRFYFTRNRYLFMSMHSPARSHLGWKLRYAHRVLRDYVRTCCDRAGRQAIISAGMSILRKRWGPYEEAADNQLLVRVLDTILISVARGARLVKRSLAAISKVAHILKRTACRRPIDPYD